MEMTKSRRRMVVVVVALCGAAALASFAWHAVFPAHRPLKDLRADEVVSIHLTENHGLTDVTLGDVDREYVAGLFSELAGDRLDSQSLEMDGTMPVFTAETTMRDKVELCVIEGPHARYFQVEGAWYQERGGSAVQKLEEVYQRLCDR